MVGFRLQCVTRLSKIPHDQNSALLVPCPELSKILFGVAELKGGE